jgi:hypothetical protein
MLSPLLYDSFERDFRTKGKPAVPTAGTVDATRDLERFSEWAAGNRGDDWIGIVLSDADRDPTFGDLAFVTLLAYPPDLTLVEKCWRQLQQALRNWFFGHYTS